MSKPLILTKREAQTLLRAAEAEHAIVEVKMGDKVIRNVQIFVLYASEIWYGFPTRLETNNMPKVALPLPVEALRTKYAYEPTSGQLYGNASGVLRPVGRLDARGYLSVDLTEEGRRRTILAHRVAYALMTGHDIPVGMFIDHINRKKTDNRWSNLRIATHQQNMTNAEQPRKNVLPRGVYLNEKSRKNPYKSKIQVFGKAIYIGSFPTIDAAKAAYEAERARHEGAFYGG